ncbi:hypothetical protein GCM10009682_33000 [Luedemannella flava]|uniref:Uncharacterized protein n=1 Tax=Luedemannella flava TaxID=349316 RepID=A0ABN2M461_9ACTN
MRVRRVITQVGIAAAVAAAAVIATPTAASAAPTGCYSEVYQWVKGGFGWATCLSGTGYYQVRITCKYAPDNPYSYHYFGTWQWPSSGRASSKACPSDMYIMSATTIKAG